MNLLDRIKRRIKGRNIPSKHSVYRELSRWWYSDVESYDMLGGDWDYLFLLDACRADVFKSVSDLPGETSTIKTGAAMTVEWLERHVAGTSLHDTVYITGNPQVTTHQSRLDPEFHAHVIVDSDHPAGVATPEAIASAARAAEREYPQKRLLVHFVQPHIPYLGRTGRELPSDLSLSEIQAQDNVSSTDIKRAYCENLELVLSIVHGLFSAFEGRFVVSADHGELLGERLRPVPVRDFGHPRGVYHDALVTVPWHTFERGMRRTVVADTPINSKDTTYSETVDERLTALGYK